jgi:hypothetical protein
MKENEVQSHQAQFLQGIEDVIPTNSSMVSELSDVLGISADSAYRRMRGETQLTIDEIIKLCDHYKISFDTFSKVKSGMVTFNFAAIDSSAESFAAYLVKQLEDVKIIASAKESKIVYACQDIPVFYHYNYPVLASFKIFYWMRTILNLPDLGKLKFDADSQFTELLETGKQIYDTYIQIPSVEVWTDTTIQSTLKQIAFYWDSGVFENKEHALRVCADLSKEIEDIQLKAEAQTKLNESLNQADEANADDRDMSAGEQKNYHLYVSEVELTNNCVLVNIGSSQAVYLSHFSFNTMFTKNQNYCRKTEAWMSHILKKSTLISGVAEKQRFQFFQNALARIDELMNRINSEAKKV